MLDKSPSASTPSATGNPACVLRVEPPLRRARVLRPAEDKSLVLPIIRHHHERWDGTGYPDGLAGEAIPLTARILQVADLYDAFTTERPYKPAFTRDQALGLLGEEASRGWWDAHLVEIFIALVRDGLAFG